MGARRLINLCQHITHSKDTAVSVDGEYPMQRDKLNLLNINRTRRSQKQNSKNLIRAPCVCCDEHSTMIV